VGGDDINCESTWPGLIVQLPHVSGVSSFISISKASDLNISKCMIAPWLPVRLL